MTAERLIDCMGMIDEKFITEAEGYVPARRTKHIAAYLSAAACICIAVTAAVVISGRDGRIETLPENSLTSITEVCEPVQTTYSAPAETTWQCEPPETEKAVPIYTESGEVLLTVQIETETAPEKTERTTAGTTETTYAPTETDRTTVGPTETTDIPEDVLVPRWEDLNEIERYTELYYQGERYSLSMNSKFTEEEVYFLENGEVLGMDEYSGEIKTKPCGLYAVKNIDVNYMLAVYTEDGMYTGYRNSGYETERLDEYLNGTDYIGRNYIDSNEFIIVKSDDMFDDEGSYYIRYDIPDARGYFENLLLSNGDAPFVTDQSVVYKGIGISVCDEKYRYISIYNGGYLYLSSMYADQYFYIGEEAFNELKAYLEENAETEKVYYNTGSGDDVDILE